MKRKLRRGLGVFLIILAIVTGPIPIIQGWVFFVAAIGVLGKDDPIIQFCFRQMERFRPVQQWFRHQMEKLGVLRPKDAPPGGPDLPT
jgi:hypothetical protein